MELQKALANFIDAKQKEAVQRSLHSSAKHRVTRAKADLTGAFFESFDDVPESVVVKFEGNLYLVEIDTEGDSCHRLSHVDEIMEL